MKKSKKPVQSKDVWCNRTLVQNPMYYGLCTDQARYDNEMDYLKVPANKRADFMPNPQADACVHYFKKADGRECAIVCMRDASKRTPIEIAGLLVHEAVHIFQAVCENVGEKYPSSEFEAYSVQWISMELMVRYEEQTKSSKKKKASKK